MQKFIKLIFIFIFFSTASLVLAQAVSDVFVLQQISIPQAFKGQNVNAIFVIENKSSGSASGTLQVSIHDTQGQAVAGWPHSELIDFTSAGTQTKTIPLEPATAPYLAAGKTYVLEARIISTSPTDGITANNSGTKTFVVPNAPATFSIPDSPPWMGALVLLGILGWLFTRKK
jgi:hypothetical protein